MSAAMDVDPPGVGELATTPPAATTTTVAGGAADCASDADRSDSDEQQQQQQQQQTAAALPLAPPTPTAAAAAAASSSTPKPDVPRSKSAVAAPEAAVAAPPQKARRPLKDPARAEAAAARRKRRKMEEEEAAMANGVGGPVTLGRQSSVRGGGGGNSFSGAGFDGAGGDSVSSYSSSAAMPISATAAATGGRLPVVVLVPGSDSIKIGLSDAARPFFFRNVVAYSVKGQDDARNGAGTGNGPSANDDGEQVETGGLRSAAAARVPVAADIVTEAELSDEEEMEAEQTLQPTDRALLARWRKKREADHASAERQLRKRGRGASAGTAAAAAGAAPTGSGGLIQPAVGPDGREESIHDAVHQQSAGKAASEINDRPRALFAPALLETAAVAATGAATAGSASYVPRHSMTRGHMNVGPSRPLRQCFSQLEDVVRAALTSCLNLCPADYPRHAVSLAVPDCWGPREVADCVDMLLVRMGFRELFLHQESVLACYGAGLASACVVDIGAERSRVVCVEDGVALPRAAIELNYGGRDVDALLEASIADKAFWARVEQARAAAKDKPQADLMQLDHRERIRRWKEKFAYCIKSDEEESATNADAVAAAAAAAAAGAAPTSVPGELTLGAALAPLGLFHPSLFPSDLRLRSASQRLALQSAEGLDRMADLFLADSNYFQYTAAGIAAAAASASAAGPNATPPATAVSFNRAMLDEEVFLTGEGGGSKRRGRKKASAAESSSAAAGSSAGGASPAKAAAPFKLDRRRKDHQALLLQYTEEQLMAGAHLEPTAEPAAAGAADSAGADASAGDATAASSSLTPAESFISARLPLQQAVAACLRALPGLELQTKLASTILLAGGSSRLAHLAGAFEERLVDCVPYLVPGVNTVNCLVRPRQTDPAELSWRGAAILAKAEANRDMWLTRDEWRRFGAKLLREKAPFPW